jgi:hypothetical protein
LSPPRWPPILDARRVPLSIRVRDLVLTIAAWCLLIWRTRAGLGLALDYMSDPIFELTRHASPDWLLIWAALGPFLGIAAMLAAMIVARGRHRRHILAQQFDAAQPAPLELDRHAARWGVPAADVARLRELRVATVRFEGKKLVAPA